MRRAYRFALVTLLFVVAEMVHHRLMSAEYPLSVDYLIPVIVAAFILPLPAVILCSVIAIVLNLADTVIAHAPTTMALVSTAGVAFVGSQVALLSLRHARTLRHSEEVLTTNEQLRAVLDSTSNGIFMYTPDLVFRVFNRRLAEWFGIAPSRVIGHPVGEVLREVIGPCLEEPEALFERLIRVLGQPDEVSQEEFVQVKPEQRTLLLYSAPVRRDREIIGRIGVVTDVTAIHLHEAEREALGRVAQALVQEQSLDRVAALITEQAQRLLRASAVAVWLVDPGSGELRLVAGRGLDEAQQIHLTSLTARTMTSAGRAIELGQRIEIPNLAAVGPELDAFGQVAREWGWRSIIVEPFRLDAGVVGAVACLYSSPRTFGEVERRLIGELARLWAAAIHHANLYEEASRRAQEAETARQNLQNFLGMVSHDLRNPVAVVLGNSQLLLRKVERQETENLLPALQAIEKASLMMARLIEDLLLAARIGSGRFAVQPAPMDLAETARRVVEQQRAATPTHRLRLEAPERLLGVWDAERISQVLTNLISNAVKYSPAGGEVEIRLGETESEVTISVIDRGIGIPPEQLARLFQPFGRLAPGQATGGAGLGLYISKSIVEAHHGRIWIESVVGQGTKVKIVLPRAPPGPSSPT